LALPRQCFYFGLQVFTYWVQHNQNREKVSVSNYFRAGLSVFVHIRRMNTKTKNIIAENRAAGRGLAAGIACAACVAGARRIVLGQPVADA